MLGPSATLANLPRSAWPGFEVTLGSLETKRQINWPARLRHRMALSRSRLFPGHLPTTVQRSRTTSTRSGYIAGQISPILSLLVKQGYGFRIPPSGSPARFSRSPAPSSVEWFVGSQDIHFCVCRTSVQTLTKLPSATAAFATEDRSALIISCSSA